ncbi:unnamed protein product, partial [Hapterophycus canaliculatus]
ARVCIGLSVPGIIFLIIIGIMFDKQGFYTSVDIEDPSAAASECYFAALLYLVAVGVSFGGIWYEKSGRGLLNTTQEELLHGDESSGLLGGEDSGYGSVSYLSQMPLMPQGYSRSDNYAEG